MNLAISTPTENSKHLKLIEDLLLIFILICSTSLQNNWWHVKFTLLMILLITHFTNWRFKFPLIFWGLTVLFTSLDLFDYYFVIANHSFVLLYFTTILFISYIFPQDRIKIIQINGLSVLLLIMFWGATQKVISPEFMSGDYISSLTLKGDLFKPLQIANVIPDAFAKNISLINENLKNAPSADTTIQLHTPFKKFGVYSLYFSIFIVVAEFAMVPILLLKNEKIKHTLLLLFLSGLLLTRFETGFISLLIILSISQLPVGEKNFKLLYLLLLAACLSLILIKIGAR
ncbi:hypothetical protein [Flavobacterium sp. SM2513]|uniref:hypothetical protein n=1 Tax=Flavobacterium sp. SM2513 TaxID=3424766 RepID=UPI003D7FD2C3